jgi:serine/threonine-protein kinase ULK/ATG1
VIKIADFGYSKVLESSDTAKSKCGTPLLMAPEVIQNKKYGHKRDVWAIGALYF